MNIFALDESPTLSAIWQHDRHVTKMTVESAQLLSWVCRLDSRYCDLLPKQYVAELYRESHKNNPLTLWAGACDANFAWLAVHGLALVAEKHRRFPLNGMHKSYPLLTGFGAVAAKLAGVERVWTRDADRNLIIDPAIVKLYESHTPFYQAMKEFPHCMVPGDPVQAYRNFYLDSKIFQDHVKWTNCESLPPFIMQEWQYPSTHAAIKFRLDQLVAAHAEGVRVAAMPRDPHPDLLKPTNPRAFTRFGSAR
jgi:hypothetical protein